MENEYDVDDIADLIINYVVGDRKFEDAVADELARRWRGSGQSEARPNAAPALKRMAARISKLPEFFDWQNDPAVQLAIKNDREQAGANLIFHSCEAGKTPKIPMGRRDSCMEEIHNINRKAAEGHLAKTYRPK